jgi:hypothetical protein
MADIGWTRPLLVQHAIVGCASGWLYGIRVVAIRNHEPFWVSGTPQLNAGGGRWPNRSMTVRLCPKQHVFGNLARISQLFGDILPKECRACLLGIDGKTPSGAADALGVKLITTADISDHALCAVKLGAVFVQTECCRFGD